MLTVVDDHSRAVWTYLMKSKVQVPSLLSTFFQHVKTQFNLVIKKVRTNNGIEFLSKQCQDLFAGLGIIHQKTYVYTP